MDHSLDALLAQQNYKGHEAVLYYFNRVLIRARNNYSLVEKEFLELMFAADKLRHYMIAHMIRLISQNTALGDVLRWGIRAKRERRTRFRRWNTLHLARRLGHTACIHFDEPLL